MKILLTHRYYYPDTPPYAMMLHTIACALQKEGHAVQVFTTMPSYKTASEVSAPAREVLNGVEIRRIGVFPESSPTRIRVLNAFWYSLRLFFHILRVRPQAVQAATFPPIVAGWVGSLAAKLVGAKFIYHMQDVHPEVSVNSGGTMGKGFMRDIATRLDNATLRRADTVVVLSEDMRKTVLSRGVDHTAKIRLINNFLLEEPDAKRVIDSSRLSDGVLNVIFAGNIGLFQGLDAFIDAARMTRDLPDLHFWFLGEGAAKADLVQKAGDMIGKTVFFAPFRPPAEATALIQQADLAIASLSVGIYRVSYPSKVLTYLGLGTPILACVEKESELAHMVEEEGIGFSAPPGDAEGLARALRMAWETREGLGEVGLRAKALYDRQFSLDHAVERWDAIYRLESNIACKSGRAN